MLDFGIAKVITGEGSQGETATGAILGTPLFMSPEQARGLKTLDYRSDLYSLGMVAFRALTGTHAFSGEAFGDLLLSICTQPLPTIHHVAPSLPPSLDGWFQRACFREPDGRFQSAEDMVEMLLVASGVTATQVKVNEIMSGGSSASINSQNSSANRVSNVGAPPTDAPNPQLGESGTLALDPVASGEQLSTSAGLAASQAGYVVPKQSSRGIVVIAAVAVLGLGAAGAFLALRSPDTPTEETAEETASEQPQAPAAAPGPEVEPALNPEPSDNDTRADDGEETSTEDEKDEAPQKPAQPKVAPSPPKPPPLKPKPVARPVTKPTPAGKPVEKPKPAQKPKPKPKPGVDMGF